MFYLHIIVVKKTKKEIKEMAEKIKLKKALKKERMMKQQENVKQKKGEDENEEDNGNLLH